LHCFGLLCNVPNLLVCLNIEQKHDMHKMGAIAKIKRATSFLNKRSGTRFHHDWKPMQSIIDILHKNFQEDHTNSRRFPGFPGVVDTLIYWLCVDWLCIQQQSDCKPDRSCSRDWLEDRVSDKIRQRNV